ncbi:lipopolysaccharide biosynthesis protein, partial [Klebsiella oxytoca]
NTMLLYVRMLFLMAVNLYTSRVVLEALGVSDFGIYNVVGGVVAMFAIVSGSLSSAISRYLTYELGTGRQERLG